MTKLTLDWSRLLGFRLADCSKDSAEGGMANAATTAPVGASANLSISGLGAKIGSKQWVRLTD